MAALDFPSSPTNGQVYGNFMWSSSKGAWQAKPITGKVTTSATAPATPSNGDEWFNTNDGNIYVYYTDVDGSQWVQVSSDATLSSTLGTRVEALEAGAVNYIINGAFEINQRAFTSTTSQVYGFDRWQSIINGGTVTYSSQSFGTAPVVSAGIEATNYARLVVSGQSTAAHYAILCQAIENIKLLSGKTVTVSFWARAASGTPSVAATFDQFNGTTYTRMSGKKIAITTNWARYSITLNVPSVSGQTVAADNLTINRLELWVSAGSDFASSTESLGIQANTFDFWGVQVQEGSTATSFRRNGNNIQDELASCQRYFQRLGGDNIGAGTCSSTSSAYILYQHIVTMRVAPSTTAGGTISNIKVINPNGAQQSAASVTAAVAGPASTLMGIGMVSASLTYGDGATALLGGDAFISFSAEL
jgi:hypothetical protein